MTAERIVADLLLDRYGPDPVTDPAFEDTARVILAAVTPIIRREVAALISDELDRAASFWRAAIDDKREGSPERAGAVARSISYADAAVIARDAVVELARRHTAESDAGDVDHG